MIVTKFGGTSVGDAEAITRLVDIVRGRLPRRPVVVVSAMGGATNALLAIAEQAARGELLRAIQGVEQLRARHLETVARLLGAGRVADELASELAATFDELAALAEALSVLGHSTARSADAIAAKGEMLSSLLVTAALAVRGIPARHVDATRVMRTGPQFGKAEPLPEAIAEGARACVLPVVLAGEVPVLGGYIGATRDGIVTTLGRGGSDYSAALLGAALGAEAIEIWTDVDGMLTVDPRLVPEARLLEHVRFDEASELASFGAKVLHPSTISPAVREGIPVFIFNARNPTGTGTRITFDAPLRPVTALAGKAGVTVVRVRSPRMLLQHGFLRTLFEVFDRHRTSVDVVATSEVSVSVTVDDATHLDALLEDLAPLGEVAVERARGIVAIVGAGLSDGTAAMARALGALAGIRVHMVSLSASGINLTLLVDGTRVPEALQRLHAEFFPGAAA